MSGTGRRLSCKPLERGAGRCSSTQEQMDVTSLSGHLLYAVAGVLMCGPIRSRASRGHGWRGTGRRGRPPRLTSGTGTATAQFSVANNGSPVYVPGPARLAGEAGDRRLAIYDGKGGIEPLNMPLGSYQAPRVSRNGRTRRIRGRRRRRRQRLGGRPRWQERPSSRSYLRRSESRTRLVGGWPVGCLPVGPRGRPGDLSPARGWIDNSRTPTKPEKVIVHIPQSWSPDGSIVLFSVGNNRSTRFRR